MPTAANLSVLQTETVLAFDDYIRKGEAAMEETLRGGSFLWSDGSSDTVRRLQRGEILAQLWSGGRPIEVPHGLIHDWIGAVSVPGTALDRTLALVQNYNHHKHIYAPDVIDSKLISRNGDDFRIYLRLLKKKVITVVLETDHAVHYSGLDDTRWRCRSYSTRIAEVQDAGKSSEKVLPPDTGHGFLWRLYSYWKFEERDGGTLLECRAISLTRDIPPGLKWVIQPIVLNLPKNSLVNTLAATRRALLSDVRRK
jgi:hypothetical protein